MIKIITKLKESKNEKVTINVKNGIVANLHQYAQLPG
jgi:hypothetical protein